MHVPMIDKSKLTQSQRIERQNIRNAYLAANEDEFRAGVRQFAERGNWFGVACILEIRGDE